MRAVKFDDEKPRVDLVDPDFIEGIAEVLTFGARKYAPNNWRRGFDYSRLIASIYRHLLAFQRGEDFDPESGQSHLYHLGCNAMFLAAIQKEHPELDDRYKGKLNVQYNTSSANNSSSNSAIPRVFPQIQEQMAGECGVGRQPHIQWPTSVHHNSIGGKPTDSLRDVPAIKTKRVIDGI